MHTVEPIWTNGAPHGGNLFEVVFYPGTGNPAEGRNGDAVDPHRLVVETGMVKSAAYSLCNFLNGGTGTVPVQFRGE